MRDIRLIREKTVIKEDNNIEVQEKRLHLFSDHYKQIKERVEKNLILS
jgi:hypothetical protein